MSTRQFWISTLLLIGLVVSGKMWAQPEQSTAATNGPRAQVLAVLKKLETVGSFRCTCVMTGTAVKEGESKPPTTVTSRIWQKGPYYRSEPVGSKSGLIINLPEGFFLYQEETGTYTQPPDFAKEAMLQGFKLPPNPSTGVERIWSDMLDSKDLKIVGTDVVDGKPAIVITYTTPPFGVGRDNIKLWLWNDNGLALRTKKTITMNEAVVGTLTTEWKDFVFEDVPDSLFEVPQNQIQKLPEDWHP